MVPANHVLAFAALVIVLVAIPGPSVLFTISRALTVGRRAADIDHGVETAGSAKHFAAWPIDRTVQRT